MYIPKRYGQSKIEKCPFCSKQAMCKNSQGISVCNDHTKKELLDLKCMCGSWLDLRTGKYGPFFVCISCGPVSLSKALDINEEKLKNDQKAFMKEEKNSQKDPTERKETIITSDDVDVYFS